MEKSSRSEMNIVEDVEHPESATIDSHIRQFITLNETVKKSNNQIQYLKKQASKLLVSNCNIDENFSKLERKVSDIDARISADTKTQLAKRQELKDFQSTRANTSLKQWGRCVTEIGNYANDLIQWFTECSRNVLMPELEDHRKECEKVSEGLAILKRELDDMIRNYDLDYIESNVDVDDLPSLNNVMSDFKSSNGNLMHAVRLTEDTLSKIQSKIKRSKIAINEYKKEGKTNVF